MVINGNGIVARWRKWRMSCIGVTMAGVEAMWRSMAWRTKQRLATCGVALVMAASRNIFVWRNVAMAVSVCHRGVAIPKA